MKSPGGGPLRVQKGARVGGRGEGKRGRKGEALIKLVPGIPERARVHANVRITTIRGLVLGRSRGVEEESEGDEGDRGRDDGER